MVDVPAVKVIYDKDQEQDAKRELEAAALRRHCKPCAAIWVSLTGGTVCPECFEDDSISEEDMLADMAERGLDA